MKHHRKCHRIEQEEPENEGLDLVDVSDQIMSADIAPVPSNTSNQMPVFDFVQHVTCPFDFLTQEPTDEFD